MTNVPVKVISICFNFNPHEREARDAAIIASARTILDFNPHEREARDVKDSMNRVVWEILIHTSVKLVTLHRRPWRLERIF